MSIRFAAFAVLALALAGCAEGGQEAPWTGPVDENGDPIEMAPTVIQGTGSITASGPVLAVGGEATPFTVTPGVTLLFAEIQWEDPVQDVDLALASPEAGMTGTAQNFDFLASGGSPGMPDSPHSLTIPNPQAGDWQASAFANGAAAMLEYHVAITLFHGETAVPSGYSAL